MNKKTILLVLGTLAFASCGHDFVYNDGALVDANAERIFGIIDPNHDWNSIASGSITVTADADLSDIVKVQILTESPFGNDEARVLNEVKVNKGDRVTLLYDAPNYYDELIAACVDSKGEYYVKVFSLTDTEVSFSNSAKARTRATDSGELPTGVGNIKLEAKNMMLSFNAERAQTGVCSIKDDKGKAYEYSEWVDSHWENDRLWKPTDTSLDNGWTITNGNIYRTIQNTYTAEEEKTLTAICNTYLKKNASSGEISTNGKRNNWQLIAENSKYFTVNNNYLISNGSPVTLVPVQMNTTEGSWNTIYYYYYNPDVTAGLSSEEEANYIKSLPKYRVINGFVGNDKYKRDKEYILAYYGDGNPQDGTTAVSFSIPKGYRIGFLNRKCSPKDESLTFCKNGCTYGDGRLNYEVNHLRGHYFSAMDKDSHGGATKNGMDFTSPRIGIFSANKRIYMCFEDGADCNFCDMIVEICQGAEVLNENMEIQGAAYTMCFEDRPNQADYDLNDVVLRCVRKNNTTLELTLVAAGADDDVILHGTKSDFDNQEVHALFGFTGKDASGHRFINTVEGGTKMEVKKTTVTIEPNKSIPEYLKGIYVVNALNNRKEIRVPTELGKAPEAIIVPDDFDYPKEQTSVLIAYPNFLSWAHDINVACNWYKFETASQIFPSLFKNQ
jgi:hypothetical protein